MQKKWLYASSISSIVFAQLTLVALFVENFLLSISLGIATLIFSAATVAMIYLQSSDNEQKDERAEIAKKIASSRAPKKHTESISHAAEKQSTNDFDEKANKESATTSKIEEIDDTHMDEESGLLSNSFFPVYLEQRITAARRTLRPVSLVIFELDGLDKNDSHSPTDRNFYISAVGDVVKRTLRESDCAFRIDANIFAAVMDDTTESGAVWAAERVRGVLHTGALAGRVTVSAGVACYPSHALETADLIGCANKALEAAKARGVDQVEIAAEH